MLSVTDARSAGFGILAAVSLAWAPAFASTKENAQSAIVQKIVQEYTGRLDEHVDSRFAEAFGTVVGCKLGAFFEREGMKAAYELAQSQTKTRLEAAGRAGGWSEALTMNALKVTRYQAERQLKTALESHCDQSKWARKFGDGNLAIARELLISLEPLIEQNQQALIRGDVGVLAQVLVGEGTRLGQVVMNAGEVDVDGAEHEPFRQYIRGLNSSELQALAVQVKGRYEVFCEPNRFFTARKKLEKVRNDVSNALEMTVSPVETMIEILVEKLIGGDDLPFKTKNIALTRYDAVEHDHTQHERQDSLCFKAEAHWELVNRELRGVALGQVLVPVAPEELRRRVGAQRATRGLLWDVKPAAEHSSFRDQLVLIGK
jgi:hypothetical protein